MLRTPHASSSLTVLLDLCNIAQQLDDNCCEAYLLVTVQSIHARPCQATRLLCGTAVVLEKANFHVSTDVPTAHMAVMSNQNPILTHENREHQVTLNVSYVVHSAYVCARVLYHISSHLLSRCTPPTDNYDKGTVLLLLFLADMEVWNLS